MMTLKRASEVDNRNALIDGVPQRRLEFRSDELCAQCREQFDSEVTLTIDGAVSLDNGTDLQYWTVANSTAGDVVDAVSQLPDVLDVRLLRTVGDSHRLEVRLSDQSPLVAFDELGGKTESALYDGEAFAIVAEFGTDTDVEAVTQAVQEDYPDLRLHDSYTVSTVCVFRHLVGSEMTERQLTALQLAYYSGYYDQPRQTTGEELADQLGISKQAFHKHLQKACGVVFEVLIGEGVELSRVDS